MLPDENSGTTSEFEATGNETVTSTKRVSSVIVAGEISTTASLMPTADRCSSALEIALAVDAPGTIASRAATYAAWLAV